MKRDGAFSGSVAAPGAPCSYAACDMEMDRSGYAF